LVATKRGIWHFIKPINSVPNLALLIFKLFYLFDTMIYVWFCHEMNKENDISERYI